MPESATITREDKRRELALWVLVSADVCGYTSREALRHFDRAIVKDEAPADAKVVPEAIFRVAQFEDFLPERTEWEEKRAGVTKVALTSDDHRAEIDAIIAKASPRWRIDRMPVIDRNLLRIGVIEMMWFDPPRPRATLNGLIELAKRYGEASTPSFVNGILDQIRKDLNLAFT